MEIDFQDGSRGGHVGFLKRMIYLFFYLKVAAILSQFSSQLVFPLRKSISKQIFKIAVVAAILEFHLE